MKYKQLIDKMTLEEKTSLLSGQNFWNTKSIPHLNVPSLMLTDGPHGVRKQGGKADHLGLNKSLPATCFPTAATLANSWDVDLIEYVGELLGKESAANDVNVLNGPGLNIKRNPLCGRNFEYFSEDPFLSGKLAAAMVRGIQSQGVSACPKHYAANSQETRRMVINEVIDERALRELYLEGFRYAVQEGKAMTVMTSYNQVNSEFANENMHLMRDILYGEWEYDGVAVTDWGGENNRVKGLIAGNQLEMPSSAGQTDREVLDAVKSGEIDESLVDESVDKLLCLLYDTLPAMGNGKKYTDKEHHEAARVAARQSIVLLKNEQNILPLESGQRVAVLGDFAKFPRYQGAGSSLINPTQLDNALDCLQNEDIEIVGYEQGFKRFGGSSSRLSKRAIKLSEQADTVLIFMGLNESSEAECIDRDHMRLPQNQLNLIDAVHSLGKKIVVVLSGGAPVEMPWTDKADAIVHTYLGGQASGSAIADVLMGRYNPSGKLAESYPFYYTDTPSASFFPGRQLSSEHRESIFVGYRYYDTANVVVRWPFGFGLSYTEFAYSDLNFKDDTVSFTIKNIGKTAGAEIAQMYISKNGSKIFRPQKELKGFVKVFLQPNEEKQVEIILDEHAFKYFHIGKNSWVEEPGEYNILVGASSKDIRLQKKTVRNGDAVAPPYDKTALPTYFSANVQNVSANEFETLMGDKLPPHDWDIEKPLGYNDTIGQAQYKKGAGHFLYNIVKLARKLCLLSGNHIAANNMMFAIHLPYRQLARMTGGIIDIPMLDGILVMINGHFWKGLGITLKAHKKKKQYEKQHHKSQSK